MKTVPSDSLLATTLRSIGDAVISCNADGSIVLMNPVAEELTGWTEAEAIGHGLAEVFVIVNETTRLPVEDPVAKVMRHGRVVALANHTLLLRRDGTEAHIDDSAAPVLHPDTGELRGVVLIFRDVSERRHAEWGLELLAESGRAMDGKTDALALLGEIGAVASRHFADVGIFDLQLASGEIRRVVGRHRRPDQQPMIDELHRFTPASVDSPHPASRALATGKAVLLNDITDATMVEAASGPEHLRFYRESLKPQSVVSVPIRSGREILGVMTFIRHLLSVPFNEADLLTAEELGRRLGGALNLARVQRELQVESERLTAVIDNVPVGVVMADPDGRIVLSNREMETIFRHPALPTASFDEHRKWVAFHPDGRRVEPQDFPLPRAIRSGTRINAEEYHYQRGDGTLAWVTLSAAPITDGSGTVTGGVVVIVDVDAAKRAQEALQLSEERFRTLIERSSVGLAISTLSGELTFMNPALLKLLDYTAEDVERGVIRWNRLTPHKYEDQDQRAIQQLLHSGVAVPYEKAYLARDGRPVPLLIGASMIPSARETDGKSEVAVFATDLSLQKRAEAALLQTEKLAAVGKLASSISHEINNPLEAVTNLLYLARQDKTLTQTTKDLLDAADRELARVSQVTSQTLRFHRQSTAATTVRPESLTEEVLRIYAARLANAGIQVSREYLPGVEMTCYEGDIRQVLNNLIGNAVDAMRVGGTLRLRTRHATRWSTGEAGVRVTIADTGAGMSSETQARIFDAFYTTKGQNGTGLGLWISGRIVHKHRGYLQVQSSTGAQHGAVFQLWLPAQLAATAREAWHMEDGIENPARRVGAAG